MQMENTMIQVKKDTAEELKKLKEYNRQSYDEIIRRLMEANEDMLTEEDINSIKKGLDDIKAGRVSSIEKVAGNIGVNLKG